MVGAPSQGSVPVTPVVEVAIYWWLLYNKVLWGNRKHVSAQSGLILYDPMNYSPPGSPCPWNFQSKNTGVGCHFLLQGIFLTQKSNPSLLSLLHWQEDSLPRAPPGKPARIIISTQWFLAKRQCWLSWVVSRLPHGNKNGWNGRSGLKKVCPLCGSRTIAGYLFELSGWASSFLHTFFALDSLVPTLL